MLCCQRWTRGAGVEVPSTTRVEFEHRRPPRCRAPARPRRDDRGWNWWRRRDRGVVALLVALCSGGGANSLSPQGDTSLSTSDNAGQALEEPLGAEDDPNRAEAELASIVLDNSQIFWSEVFAENDLTYQDAHLVLFDSATPTACGQGDAGMGPFYCSLDQSAYLDLTFWRVLESQFGATATSLRRT